ncbi:MAG: hypothetical protein AAGC47_11070 [Bacteroidota bacterium]
MYNAKLIKWFIAWAILMVIVIVLTLPSSRPPKIDTVGFETTESAQLYFKNVRAFYYNKGEGAGGIFETYRLQSLFTDSITELPFVIYNNWRTNESFIRLDTNFNASNEYIDIITDSASVKKDTIAIPQLSNEAQYVFAKEVYKSLQSGKRLGMLTEEGIDWIKESDQVSIKRALTDYFRLVNKI